MVIEVGYKTKKDAADPDAKFIRTEFFESATIPNRDAIIRKLTEMQTDFDENTIEISQYEMEAERLKTAGFRVTPI